jgi:hypothetical protein
MHNFALASPPIPNIKFLSFVISEKCVILKICTFSIKNQDLTNPLPEVNFLMVDIPPPKPYIFMIRVTRQIKCLIAQALGPYPTPYLK